MKRLLSILLVGCLLCGTISTTAFAALNSYDKAYAYHVMDTYLEENIEEGMTEYEKADICGNFPLPYGYDLSYNTAPEMIIYGAGNCWAVTDAIIYMLKQLGIECEALDGTKCAPLYEDSLHRNVRAKLDGKYYIVDFVVGYGGGVMGRAPDSYSLYEATYNPSCTSDGKHIMYDTAKGTTVSETLPALGHLDENQDGVCERCGEVICEEHTPETLPAVEVTCEQDGLTEGSRCSSCGKILAEQSVIPAVGHEFTDGVCVKCGSDNPFTDVASGEWFYESVLWAFRSNVTGGKTETTFAPNEGCTRAQVVTFLWAANGKPEPKSLANPFSDVASDAWYLKPVLWAVENGITGGISEDKFGPEQTCTRGQIVTFLYAAEKKPDVDGTSAFKDVSDSDWFAKPVIWAAENDVTGGIGGGKFGPNDTCTRAQVVTFLKKVYGE